MDSTRLLQLLLFAANGLCTAVIYSAVVWTLIAASPETFAVDVVVAYAVATAANYLVARFVFKPTGGALAHLPRYLVVVAGNFAFTAAAAWLLHRLGTWDAIAAYAPVVVTAVPTFVLMRMWVFRPDSLVHDD
jgi:putative flippase GtrA